MSSMRSADTPSMDLFLNDGSGPIKDTFTDNESNLIDLARCTLINQGRVSRYGFKNIFYQGRVSRDGFKNIFYQGRVSRDGFKYIFYQGRVSRDGFKYIFYQGVVSRYGFKYMPPGGHFYINFNIFLYIFGGPARKLIN